MLPRRIFRYLSSSVTTHACIFEHKILVAGIFSHTPTRAGFFGFSKANSKACLLHIPHTHLPHDPLNLLKTIAHIMHIMTVQGFLVSVCNTWDFRLIICR